MRRFLTYFNALLLGVILGMILLAIGHSFPAARSKSAHISGITTGEKTLAISISLIRCAHEQRCSLRK